MDLQTDINHKFPVTTWVNALNNLLYIAVYFFKLHYLMKFY